jgi:hypothetical protein
VVHMVPVFGVLRVSDAGFDRLRFYMRFVEEPAIDVIRIHRAVRNTMYTYSRIGPYLTSSPGQIHKANKRTNLSY